METLELLLEEDILVPIFICCIMPICIVLIVTVTRKKREEKQAEVIIKAIEHGIQVNPGMLKLDLPKKNVCRNRAKTLVMQQLRTGCILLALGAALAAGYFIDECGAIMPAVLCGLIGAAFIAVFLVFRKMLAPEMEAEEKKNVEKIISGE